MRLDEIVQPTSFDVRKKKTGDNVWEFYANGHPVATLERQKDWVKGKETDRINTKMAWMNHFRWNAQGLSELFGRPITVRTWSPFHKEKPDFIQERPFKGAAPKSEWVEQELARFTEKQSQ